MLSTDGVATFPWPSSITPKYQVTVDITQLDTLADGGIALGAGWTLYGGGGERLPAMRRSRISTVAGSSVEGAVMAMSRVIEALSREIAAVIKSCEAGAMQRRAAWHNSF